jgi:para-nitrobenzyl esterase
MTKNHNSAAEKIASNTAFQGPVPARSWRQIKWDTVPLNFSPNSLKTNDPCTCKVGHFRDRPIRIVILNEQREPKNVHTSRDRQTRPVLNNPCARSVSKFHPRRSLVRTASFCIAAVLTLAGWLASSAATEETVHLDSGVVAGATEGSSAVRVFRGIPYAAPPVGNLRWQPPQPVAHWDGTRIANEFGAMCMQPAFRGGAAPAPGAAPLANSLKMTEDCLFLNVWTAAASKNEHRPVMVWIHPGGYSTGSGSAPGYNGEALARKGVVLVTINYRLGIFGFFSHPELTKESENHASGNYGFMDQIAALQWVQKNIAAFGGDPKRVTVFGDSAGSASISNLMASPLAKGLFQRASGESGAWMGISLQPMRTLPEAEQSGMKLAEEMHAGSLAELRAKPADELLKGGRGGGPVIDGWILPEDPARIFAEGKQNDVPLIVGSNKDEGTFFLQPTTAEKFIESSRKKFGDQADAFLKLYPAESDEQANASQLAAFRDELAFVMRVWARAQTKTGRSKAYLYYFTHEPPAPAASTTRGASGAGATHGAEAQFIFQNSLPPRAWTDLDHQVSETMSTYWVNFATSGDPNGKGLSKWPPFDAKKIDRPMILGDRAETGPGLNAAQLAFFEQVYEKGRGGDPSR